jgi:hypothetical protein
MGTVKWSGPTDDDEFFAKVQSKASRSATFGAVRDEMNGKEAAFAAPVRPAKNRASNFTILNRQGEPQSSLLISMKTPWPDSTATGGRFQNYAKSRPVFG